MNEKLFMFIHCLKIPANNTRCDLIYASASTRKNDILAPSLSFAVNSIQL